MNDFTVNLVKLALDTTLMRQTAIAHNIANAGSNNYQSIAIDFENRLKQVETMEDLARVKPTITSQSTPVRIDQQMAMSVKNATHYRALIKGLNKHFALMQIATKG